MVGASSPGPVPSGPSLVRRAAITLLALAAFVGTAAAIRKATPWPEEYGLRPKRDWFVEHKDEFDVLFLGTSRTFRGIDPRIVDAELAAAGVTGEAGPLRSFNFGVGGMLRFETDYVLDELLEARPARLRIVVIEGDPWDPATDFLNNTFSSRSVFWHDLERTRLALHSVQLMDKPLGESWRISWIHIQLCAMKMLSMGQGTRIPASWFGESIDPFQRSLSYSQIAEAAGYQPYEAFIAPGPTTWDQLLDNDPEHAKSIMGRVRAANDRPPELERYNLRALEAQEARVRDAGARMVVLLVPGDLGGSEESALAQRGDVEHLLDFNRPERYPQYWARGARIEDFHLTRSSAVELSKSVAAELARILRPGG